MRRAAGRLLAGEGPSQLDRGGFGAGEAVVLVEGAGGGDDGVGGAVEPGLVVGDDRVAPDGDRDRAGRGAAAGSGSASRRSMNVEVSLI